jgi:uncharacterized damage-inducible protein DinB
LPPSSEIQLLLSIIDQAYDRRSWHGTNLRGSIRGLSAERAARRPRSERHNIWEVVVHTAYWKYAVTRRLTGQKRGSFPLKGSNFFPRTESGNEKQWREDIALLEQTHRALREAVAMMSPRDLPRTAQGGKVTNAFLITGIAAHDLYHAGQIQLLKRLV